MLFVDIQRLHVCIALINIMKPEIKFMKDETNVKMQRDLIMIGMMSSECMDVESYGKSESYAGITANKQLMSQYNDEGSKEVISYWEKAGLKKELHQVNEQTPWTKWASYLPMAFVNGTSGDKLYPLLFVLHGSGNPIYLAESYGYTSIAAREEVIVIIPEDENADNIERLLNYAYENYPVDPSRVYMVGYSLGGFMSSRRAIRWPEKFAAVGIGGMLFANGHMGDHTQNGLIWKGEDITVDMAERAAKYRIPVCHCFGEYEVLGLIPVTRNEPVNGWAEHLSEEEKKRLQEIMPPRPPRRDVQPETEKKPERINLSGSNKIRSINNWRIANGCLPISESLVRQTVKDTADIVVEKIGFPFEKTSVEVRENRSHFIGDCVSPDGEVYARFIGIAKAPHWPSQALCELTWEFISRFSRDPETGISHIVK